MSTRIDIPADPVWEMDPVTRLAGEYRPKHRGVPAPPTW